MTMMDRIRINMYKKKFMYISRGLGVVEIAWKIRENRLKRFRHDVQGSDDEIMGKKTCELRLEKNR